MKEYMFIQIIGFNIVLTDPLGKEQTLNDKTPGGIKTINSYAREGWRLIGSPTSTEGGILIHYFERDIKI
jgi:hypothetical protein